VGSSLSPIAAHRVTHTYAGLREQIYRDPSLWSTYAALQQQIYRHARFWGRDPISKGPRSSSSTRIKILAAIAALLGLVFWLSVGVSIDHPLRPSYPYYDTQKPVPPWSEPMPIEGNYDRSKQHY
jgi:hypothetical protein